MTGRSPAPQHVRSTIGESWKRCLGAEVDYQRDQAPSPISQDRFELLREQCGDLIDASTPVMASARDFLHETGTVMVLADPEGTILSLEGDIALEDATQKIHLMPGANWSEFTCGTNAIGTAIETGQPIQIHSNEHFCLGIKKWSCSAAVVRDPCDGSILGAIDVSGLRSSYSRHSMALVVATAARIENRIAQIEMDFRYRLLEKSLDRLPSGNSDGVVIFDRHGRAIKANADVTVIMRDLGAPSEETRQGLPALAFHWDKSASHPERLPPWIRQEWLTPIYGGGERLGAILTIPARFTPLSRLRKEPASPARNEVLKSGSSFATIIGKDPALLNAVERTRQVAASAAPVLLLGETGVGKEVFARSLHEASNVAKGPFVALNCGGLSRDLLTSELFGYAEGSFTGARKGGMTGKIEAASGGTLFLDEIGEMPLDVQPLFLRVLEEREVCRIGETRARKVDFRLVAATNRDLRKEVELGRFRMDLFYRVSVIGTTIPPLRDRIDDIPDLAAHFVRQLASRYDMRPRGFSTDLLEALKRHSWPGNIRELRNVMESMLLTSNGTEFTEADLPLEIRTPTPISEITAAKGEFPELTPMECAERDAILRMIRARKGNLAAVARELGIAKSTVYAKLKKFGLESHVDGERIS
jgi:transcriptional regulator of acetoin/glycerol metabolism